MALLLFLVFIVLPLLELYVIIQVGGAIGVVPVLLLLLADGFIGAALARSQGRQVWVRFNETMAAGRIPAREILDGAMIMFGGALLLSPGFITDILGIFLLIPPGRAAMRAILKRSAARTPAGRPVFFVYDRIPGTGGGSRRPTGSAANAGTPPPRRTGPIGGDPFARPRSPGYDVEGSAREIDDSEYSLPEGDDDAADTADTPGSDQP